MVLDRRKRRYQEEKYMYEVFVINRKEENVVQATFKDRSLKSYYGKP
jgi:hypothetical protein